MTFPYRESRTALAVMALSVLAACGRTRDYGDVDSGGFAGSPEGGAGGTSAGGSGGKSDGGSGGSGASGGSGGSVVQDECVKASDCAQPADECQKAVCDGGQCAIEDLPAGDSCSDGVCSGTGSCGECVPGEGKCTDRTPTVCSEDGKWEEQPECSLGSMCQEGDCRGLTFDWVVQADSANWVDPSGLGLDGMGQVVFSGDYSRSLELKGQTVSQQEPYTDDTFVARLTPDGTLVEPVSILGSENGYENGRHLTVAPNGNQYFAMMAGGPLVGGTVTGSAESTSYALVASFNATGDERFEQSFWPPGTVSGATVQNPRVIPTANGNRAYALFEFREEVRWNYPATPGYQSETKAGCNKFLAELNGGIPVWHTTYRWCDDSSKFIIQGIDGSLYLGGNAGWDEAAAGPSTLGGVTFKDSLSTVLVRVDQTNGAILKVLELSSANLQALAALPSGGFVAAFLTTAPIVIGALELPASAGYLVRFDEDLNPTGSVALGQGNLTAFQWPSLWLAVSPAGEIFVGGGIKTSFDFGAGLHEYQGTSVGGKLGDGFVAGYDSELKLMFSETYGSAANDRVEGVATDGDHLYVLLTFADTIDLGGTLINPVGQGSAAVLKYTLH